MGDWIFLDVVFGNCFLVVIIEVEGFFYCLVGEGDNLGGVGGVGVFSLFGWIFLSF